VAENKAPKNALFVCFGCLSNVGTLIKFSGGGSHAAER